jgi:RNA polymerase sigma-70 factor, ECF subfamily
MLKLHALGSLLPLLQSESPVRAPNTGPDAAYLDALRSGDPGAWRDLFENEVNALHRYAYGRLGRAEDAEEVVSLTFETAWKNIQRFEDRGLPLRAWLFGIARNLTNRHGRRFMAKSAQISLDAFEVEVAGPDADPRLADLALALAGMEQRQAEVISLRFLHGLTIRETASILEISEEAVKGRQKRALEALRSRVEVAP